VIASPHPSDFEVDQSSQDEDIKPFDRFMNATEYFDPLNLSNDWDDEEAERLLLGGSDIDD